MLKAALHNLGCKVNTYETEAMAQILEKNGYEIVPFEEKADVYIINTCTVTNIADRKSRQMLHKARGMNPDAVVVAVGCYAQMRGKELEKDPAIDLIIGSDRKGDLVQEGDIIQLLFQHRADGPVTGGGDGQHVEHTLMIGIEHEAALRRDVLLTGDLQIHVAAGDGVL